MPLLAGCAAAYLISLLLDRHSIMTEKLARRGASVRTEYAVDHLAHVLVRDAMTRDVVTLRADHTVEQVLASLPRGSHQGFPVIDAAGMLAGVVTRRDLLEAAEQPGIAIGSLIRRPPVVVFEHNTMRDAADHMVTQHVGRLPVVSREQPGRLVGIVTRSDLLAAHAPRLRAARDRSILRPMR